MKLLAAHLGLPASIATPERYRVSAVEALAITCARLAFPCRAMRMQVLVGRSDSAISAITLYTVMHLYSTYHALLYWDKSRLSTRLQLFAQAIVSAGSPLQHCWGFIDGTARPIARPKKHQRLEYSGYIRGHCLKYHAVVTPDGIISHVFGPVVGKHHDMFVLQRSGLLDLLREEPFDQYVLFGDPGYSCSQNICSPFKGSSLNDAEQAFNQAMSSSRVAVEWAFGRVVSLWASLDFTPQQRSGQSPLGAVYHVAVLLTNMRTILDGRNIISDKFHVPAPTMDAYLHL